MNIKTKVILFYCLAAAFVATPAFAHPPTDLAAQYDNDKKILQITVTHPTGKQRKHYLRSIRIYQNDVLFKEFIYQWQKHKLTVSQSVEITFKDTDAIKIVTADNGGGVREFIFQEKK